LFDWIEECLTNFFEALGYPGLTFLFSL